jgi:hypothetical protein
MKTYPLRMNNEQHKILKTISWKINLTIKDFIFNAIQEKIEKENLKCINNKE